jgi:hypothetical protein
MSQNPTVQAQATETSGNDAVAPLGKPRHEVTSAPQWKLIWWRFRRHRLAMIGLVIMIALYIGAAFAGFLAPYNTSSYSGEHAYQPPQVPHLSISEGFYIHPTTGATDPETLAPVFTEDTTRTVPLRFLVKSTSSSGSSRPTVTCSGPPIPPNAGTCSGPTDPAGTCSPRSSTARRSPCPSASSGWRSRWYWG